MRSSLPAAKREDMTIPDAIMQCVACERHYRRGDSASGVEVPGFRDMVLCGSCLGTIVPSR